MAEKRLEVQFEVVANLQPGLKPSFRQFALVKRCMLHIRVGLIKFSSEPNYAKFACFVTVRGLDPFRCIFHFFNLRLDAFTSWFANLAKNGVFRFSLFQFELCELIKSVYEYLAL